MFFSPYSVDARLFEHQKQEFGREMVRSEIGASNEDIVILFSGKLIPRKAPLLLIQSLAKLPNSSKVILLLVGEGPLRAEIEAAGRAILGNRLHITGFVNQSQIGNYYAASDVFVLPSEYETWGLVVNEAMQFGLPIVVSSNVGCGRDLVTEGETGFVFEAGDADDLARCLAKFIDDPALAPRMSRNALARISKYSIDNTAAGIEQAVAAATKDKAQQ
jgi:glycosyltransferase involved in cell wall biosynthesis